MNNTSSDSQAGQKERAKSYQRRRLYIRIANLLISVIFLLSLQFLGLSGIIKNIAFSITSYFYIALAIYFLIFSILSYIVNLPTSFYSGYILEHRFSLSNQTFYRWLTEDLKGAFISFFVTVFVIEILYTIGLNSHSGWWFIAALFWILFTLGFSTIFPIIIMPLFYKYIPLKNEDLKQRVFELAGKYGIKVKDICEIDYSKNTRTSNAAVIGCGKTRRIVFADNLINEFTPEEIEVVTAHEMAHYKLRHVQKMLTVQITSTIIFFYCLSLILPILALKLGASGPFDILIFPTILVMLSIYSFLMAPPLNAYYRKLETDADASALAVTQNPSAFISLMKRLADKNLSDENPHPLVEYLFYTHPPISKRIRMGERYAKG